MIDVSHLACSYTFTTEKLRFSKVVARDLSLNHMLEIQAVIILLFNNCVL